MIVESIVIFGIILAIVILSYMSKKTYTLAIAPLLIPAGVNILAVWLSPYLADITPIDKFTMYTFINLIAAAVSCVFIGICSVRFKNKASKATYIVMCVGFNLVLAFIFIYNAFLKIN